MFCALAHPVPRICETATCAPEPRCPVDTTLLHATSHSPRQNLLLAALQAEDLQRLLPHLEPLRLPSGQAVYEAGDRMEHVLFPTEGIVSKAYVTQDGASAAVALIGREGAVGMFQFMGGGSAPSRAVVQSDVHAYRLGFEVLRREFERGGALQRLLLRFAEALITQVGQTAVCNRHHAVEQQLCRWLLLSLDRLSSGEIHMTQELIAGMLGVRREGVTEAARRLQDASLIRYHRGHITVTDRAGLERRVCECYAAVRRETDRLLH